MHKTNLLDLYYYIICIILKRIGGDIFETAWEIYSYFFSNIINYKL